MCSKLLLLLLYACFCFISTTYLVPHTHCLPLQHSYHASSSSSSSSSSSNSPTSGSFELKRISLSIVFGLVSGFILAVFVASLIRCFLVYFNTPPLLNGPVVFSPKIDPSTLVHLPPLSNPNHLPSSTSTYFTTSLNNALTVAVKLVRPFPQSRRKLHHHLQLLATLRHPHLMTLRAYVPNPDNTFSLIYDYMTTGSLDDAMIRVRQNHLHLPWDLRLRIALGIVKALKFLHFESSPSLLHYNLKPGNVILDADFEPKLADFGLAKLMPKFYASPNGYTPPDYSQSCSYGYTDKSDVFSFGVILAVLLTGRDPLDPFFGEPSNGGSLGRWLRHMQQAGEARQALDKSNLGQENEEDEMLMAVRIAVACMSEHPEDRPSSDELVPMLSRLHSF